MCPFSVAERGVPLRAPSHVRGLENAACVSTPNLSDDSVSRSRMTYRPATAGIAPRPLACRQLAAEGQPRPPLQPGPGACRYARAPGLRHLTRRHPRDVVTCGLTHAGTFLNWPTLKRAGCLCPYRRRPAPSHRRAGAQRPGWGVRRRESDTPPSGFLVCESYRAQIAARP